MTLGLTMMQQAKWMRACACAFAMAFVAAPWSTSVHTRFEVTP